MRAGTGIMGGTENAVTLLTAERAEAWPRMSKDATAERLADRIAAAQARYDAALAKGEAPDA